MFLLLRLSEEIVQAKFYCLRIKFIKESVDYFLDPRYLMLMSFKVWVVDGESQKIVNLPLNSTVQHYCLTLPALISFRYPQSREIL